MIKTFLLVLHTTAAMNNGLARTPPLGWSTWETCADAACTHDFCNEAEVKAAASALVDSGLRDAGWRYVNLDDCWAASTRNATDDSLMWDTTRFPKGIPALAQWLHARGLLLGLYTSAGNETCHGGLPGSRDHYDLDAKTFASWSVDSVKLDWCGDIKTQLLQGAKAHREFAAAMNASGRPMVLEVVAGYFFLGAQIGQYANAWRFCEDHHDSWKSTAEELVCTADELSTQGAPGGWAHLDMLVTGGAGCAAGAKYSAHCAGMSDDEYRVEFTLWSLLQSPLIVATDVRELTPIMREAMLNSELLAAHQSTATPPGRRLGSVDCGGLLQACAVWGRPLAPDNTTWLVALVNVGSKANSISIGWEMLGWDAARSAQVRDLWAHSDLPDATGSLAATVPSHGVAAFRLAAGG